MKQEEIEKERQEIKKRNEELEIEKREKAQKIKEQKEIYKQKARESLKKRNKKSLWDTYKDYIGYAVLGAVFLFILITNFTGDRRKLSEILVNDERYIIDVNDSNGSFEVAPNELFEGKTLANVKEMTNNRFSPKKTISRCNPATVLNVDVPKNYNFYHEYPDCKTEELISKNSSGYIQITLSAWRNRNCRAGGDPSFIPALEYFYRCDTKFNTADKGGYAVSSIEFMLKSGIINEFCWADIKGEENKCPSKEQIKTCSKEYVESFCVFEKVEEIKKEITKNGPVISFLPAYRNFLIYKKGHYELQDGLKADGMFFVKIVGFETDVNGEEYWIVDPLFGSSWGQNGVAYVRIGTTDSFLDQVGLSIVTTSQEKASGSSKSKDSDEDEEDEE